MANKLNPQDVTKLIVAFIKAGDVHFEGRGRLVGTSETAMQWMEKHFEGAALSRTDRKAVIVPRVAVESEIGKETFLELQMIALEKKQNTPRLN